MKVQRGISPDDSWQVLFCSKHLVDLDIIYMSTYMYWVIRFHEKSPGPWNFAKFCSFLNAISVLFINYLYTNAIWMIERLISTTPPPMDEIFWRGGGAWKLFIQGWLCWSPLIFGIIIAEDYEKKIPFFSEGGVEISEYYGDTII